MRMSDDWLRRFWSGSCDGAVYDVQELYPLHPQRLRSWDSVINYTRLLKRTESAAHVSRRTQKATGPIRFLLNWSAHIARLRRLVS